MQLHRSNSNDVSSRLPRKCRTATHRGIFNIPASLSMFVPVLLQIRGMGGQPKAALLNRAHS